MPCIELQEVTFCVCVCLKTVFVITGFFYMDIFCFGLFRWEFFVCLFVWDRYWFYQSQVKVSGGQGVCLFSSFFVPTCYCLGLGVGPFGCKYMLLNASDTTWFLYHCVLCYSDEKYLVNKLNTEGFCKCFVHIVLVCLLCASHSHTQVVRLSSWTVVDFFCKSKYLLKLYILISWVFF